MKKLSLFLICLLLPAVCRGAVITVNWDGSGDYLTIQAAINDANHNDKIIVAAGTYFENINFNGKNIILRSTDPNDSNIVAATIIDGSQNGSVVTFAGTEDSLSVQGRCTNIDEYGELQQVNRVRSSGGCLGCMICCTYQLRSRRAYSPTLFGQFTQRYQENHGFAGEAPARW